MFRHIVLLAWTADATAEQKADAAAQLAKLPGAIPEIRHYEIGVDAGVNEGNHDLAVVADFDDVDGYLVYRDHPAHLAVITDYLKPILATRAAVQHQL
ncbi:Dabb family protein [Acrocarpospora macrocephala]|uniref:Stress protein n=1 Tax=Acrocarpospora macrocephala TaxID=150177 RepID=A0A5M3X4Q2_9ACTN|nr:Dabb family protein [Acrocarpospora macrocephala]GES16090.1 stress protein [Acrocarpospora macrocephala]